MPEESRNVLVKFELDLAGEEGRERERRWRAKARSFIDSLAVRTLSMVGYLIAIERVCTSSIVRSSVSVPALSTFRMHRHTMFAY